MPLKDTKTSVKARASTCLNCNIAGLTEPYGLFSDEVAHELPGIKHDTFPESKQNTKIT